MPAINAFLQQGMEEQVSFQQSCQQLVSLAEPTRPATAGSKV